MNQDYYIELIYLQLSGQIEPAAKKELQDWLLEDEENALMMRQIEAAWASSEGYQGSKLKLDLDAEFAQLLEKRETEARRVKPRKRRMHLQWSIAASVLLFLFAGLMYFLMGRGAASPHTLEYVALEDKSELQLADGTKVLLQKGTTLTYPEKMDGKIREVTLKGEAFFDVAHNPAKPFEVTTNLGKVQVLGTSFYLSSKVQANELQLKVVTGKVRMSAKGVEESLVVVAGEQAVADVAARKIAKVETLQSGAFSWDSQSLIFSDTPLKQVVEGIEAAYSISVQLENADLKQCPFSATFEENQPIEEVLSVIEQVFEAKLLKEADGKYRLKGGICE